jgi:hypothetical protein
MGRSSPLGMAASSGGTLAVACTASRPPATGRLHLGLPRPAGGSARAPALRRRGTLRLRGGGIRALAAKHHDVVVRRHGDARRERETVTGGLGLHVGQVPHAPARVAGPQARIEGLVAGRGVAPVQTEGAVEQEQAPRRKTTGGPAQQRDAHLPGCDVDQVRGEDRLEGARRPVVPEDVEAPRRARCRHALLARPRLHHVEERVVAVRGLPAHLRQGPREEGRVLAGAAGHLQHPCALGEPGPQHLQDRLPVARRGGGCAARRHPGSLAVAQRGRPARRARAAGSFPHMILSAR